MGRDRDQRKPPHEAIQARQQWEIDRDAFEAGLEAKYGIPYAKLPGVLRLGMPEHPQRDTGRRFDYRTLPTYRFNYAKKSERRQLIAESGKAGWRHRRAGYLLHLEAVRQAEAAVRKLRAVKKGRGKRLPKNLIEQKHLAIENRELREKQ
jgi:hypothetical protein